jgi:hypothetical protein
LTGTQSGIFIIGIFDRHALGNSPILNFRIFNQGNFDGEFRHDFPWPISEPLHNFDAPSVSQETIPMIINCGHGGSQIGELPNPKGTAQN